MFALYPLDPKDKDSWAVFILSKNLERYVLLTAPTNFHDALKDLIRTSR